MTIIGPEPAMAVGDRIKFVPQNSTRWWTIRARDEQFIIATQQAPFEPRGELQYTVVDLTGWTYKYNGVGPGVVRSSLDAMGGGWPYDDFDEASLTAALADLQAERWSLSRRRVMGVDRFIVQPAPAPALNH